MDLKKISDEDLWERLLGMVQDPCVAMASKIMDEIDRRITEANARADRLAAEVVLSRKIVVQDEVDGCLLAIWHGQVQADEMANARAAVNAAGDLEVK
jgi:hypothetical protein